MLPKTQWARESCDDGRCFHLFLLSRSIDMENSVYNSLSLRLSYIASSYFWRGFFEIRAENYPLHFFLYPSSIVITFIRLETSSQTFSQLVPSTYCHYFHTPLIPLKDLTHPSKLAPKKFYLGLSLIHLIQSLYWYVHASFPNPQPLSYVYKYCLRIPLRLQILKN